MSLQIKLFLVLPAANQSGGSEMITVCQTAYVYMTCTQEHSGTTLELLIPSVMSEENGP